MAALVLTPAHPPSGMKGRGLRQIHLRSAQQLQLWGGGWGRARCAQSLGSLCCTSSPGTRFPRDLGEISACLWFCLLTCTPWGAAGF